MKTVKIMRGPSCVGKSTQTNMYAHLYGRTSILSSDFFRELLLGDKSKQTKNQEVFKMLHDVLDMRLSQDVRMTIIDATNLKIKDVTPVIDICDKYYADIHLINMHPPSLEVLLQRNYNRYIETGFFVPEQVIERHYQTFTICYEAFENLEKVHPRFKIFHIYPSGD